MFKNFAAEQQVKLEKLPVFCQGAEFYCNLFKFDASEIFAQLEQDMKRTRDERDQMLKLKEEKVKNLLDGLLECFESMQTKSVLAPALVGRSREDSLKTLRDLPLFGYPSTLINFRYPSIWDLQAMPSDKPIQAVGFKWKKSGDYIGAFQVIMSNGCNSPVFSSKEMNADNLQEVKITPQVKKIRGTTNMGGKYAKNIYFQAKDGTEISRIVAYETELAPDQILEEDEEIIGIYGTKD